MYKVPKHTWKIGPRREDRSKVTILNTPISEKRYKAAFDELIKTSPYNNLIGKKLNVRRLAKTRRDICGWYWSDQVYAKSASHEHLKPYAKKLDNALRNLEEVIRSLPAFASNGITDVSGQTRGLYYFPEALEPWRAACSQISESMGKPGRRSTDHIDRALHRISQLWHDITGSGFPKTISTPTAKAQEFIAPGPQFALTLIQAIDPEVTFSQVKTALRKDVWREPIQD